jgi:ribosomal protein S18 acetylase RimI-like enzyme
MCPTDLDFSAPTRDDPDSLARDRIPVRSLAESDLPAIITIDRKITGRDRTAYYRRKLAEMLTESGVRVSLVAELDGLSVGFLMARVDYGEFGRTDPTAVIDTIGVSPDFAQRGVGQALLGQLLLNLASLRVERVKTRVAWDDLALLGFLRRQGFTPAQRLSFTRRVA